MKHINDRIASRRSRTPGKELQQDQLGSAVGGGCCIQGCSGCDMFDPVPLPTPIPFPTPLPFPGGQLPSFP